MRSMTAYAYREKSFDNATVSVELKGYNSRFLDLQISLPSWFSSFEPELRKYLSSRFSRGKIDASIRIREINADFSVTVNKAAAAAYFNAINSLGAELSLGANLDLNNILSLEGVLEIEKKRDTEKFIEMINPILFETSDQFDAERIREGKHTEEHILSELAVLEKSLDEISLHVPKIESSIKENLKTRFEELLGDRIDENRILAETAVLLVKNTISEEVSRLSSHLKEFRLVAEQNPSPGKKLDFLCQEINREVNTIGSKSSVLELSRAVVEMKNALENIREDLRNVE